MIGQTLGHYKILDLLGAGGMGEVYRAEDTTLEREVALKVLPEAFTQDPERLARFEREAKVLATLDHPNIAAVYSFEEAQELHFLVMQLAEGESLAARIARGPMALDEALPIASQIAEALESAHERGIIHRDLKPANVNVDSAGHVRVLDFGLAKALAAPEDSGDGSASSPTLDLSASPTLTAEMTAPGVLLGTVGYMSPEQARGKPADRRSDIWAFGCVLYEMLTAKRVFGGETSSDSLARILEREPDWEPLPVATPTAVRTLLRRCLAKDPRRRLHDMADVRLELEEAPEEAALEPLAHPPAALWKRLAPWALALLGVLIGLWSLVRPQPTPTDVAVTRFALQTGALPLASHPFSSIVELSPDGRTLAYVVGEGGTGRIYLRRLDSLESVAVAGVEKARTPFFSPDGKWLGFETDGELKKVSVDGGKAWPICKAAGIHGATWGEDGTIIFGSGLVAASTEYALFEVSADGGEPEVLLEADRSRGEVWLVWPQLLPDGKSVLYTGVDGAGDAIEISLLDLETRERKTVLEGGGNSRYLSTGHLAYPLDGSLMVAPFDLDRGEIVGGPVSAIDGLMMGFAWDPPIAHFSVADTGTLAFVAGPIIAAGSQLVRVDRAGFAEPIGDTLEKIRGPRFSQDGRRIAVSTDYKDLIAQLWMHDLDRETLTRLTFENQGWWPIWTPDSQRLTFTSMPPGEGVANLYWMPADGSAPPQRLTHSKLPVQATSFSPDGRTLILNQSDHPETAWDVMMLRLDGESREPQPLLSSQFWEALAELSPDGRWLAYSSNESGRFEVYVRSFPDLDRKWQISADGGIESTWSRDGTELFYRDEEGLRLMVVDIVLEPAFRPGKPRLLFEESFVETPGYGRNYDVAPDGESFLMVRQEMKGLEEAEIHIMLDWFDEVRRRAPSGESR